MAVIVILEEQAMDHTAQHMLNSILLSLASLGDKILTLTFIFKSFLTHDTE